jgi:Tol biopolymer transport system component
MRTSHQLALAVLFVSGFARGQTTSLISHGLGGPPADGHSRYAAMSADGRFVVFHSNATNLVAGDTNAVNDVFVWDRLGGPIERVSVGAGGLEANAQSINPVITPDGRYVAFQSLASNLVPGDTNGVLDIFVLDRQSGTFERVSVDSSGAQSDQHSEYPSISADGQVIAFISGATNLVPNDANGYTDAFVHDRSSGTTERVSVSSGGIQSNAPLYLQSSISADGRFVVFNCRATNLVALDTNSEDDVFVHDRQTGMTDLVSISTGGVQGDERSNAATISADGRFVTFDSVASNLVAGDTNDARDVFVRDRLLGTTERISVSTGGMQAGPESQWPTITPDGRFVAFWSSASNLVTGDTNGVEDVFLHERQSGTTERVSVSTSGTQGNIYSQFSALSADGRFVAFHSAATNLVPGDTNEAVDVFLRDRAGQPPVLYCFGDGSGAPCPCGPGTVGNGCPNSVNAGGAHLAASGNSILLGDTLVLSGTGMPNSSCLYFQGTIQTSVPFGDGLRCVGGTTFRLGLAPNSQGASLYPAGGAQPISLRGVVTAPGMRTYQAWYHNAAAFCTPATFNFTNGVVVTWTL